MAIRDISELEMSKFGRDCVKEMMYIYWEMIRIPNVPASGDRVLYWVDNAFARMPKEDQNTFLDADFANGSPAQQCQIICIALMKSREELMNELMRNATFKEGSKIIQN